MKELTKPTKEKKVFQKLNVMAFHEDHTGYTRGGTYYTEGPAGSAYGDYEKFNHVDNDGVLF